MDLPVLLYHHISVMASIAIICWYLPWCSRVIFIKWKKNPAPHTKKNQNRSFLGFFFKQNSVHCCELLVSIEFCLHSSPPVFFLKPSSLLGGTSLNEKRIGKDEAIPLIETEKKKGIFHKSGRIQALMSN